jgi:hypothetical protein
MQNWSIQNFTHIIVLKKNTNNIEVENLFQTTWGWSLYLESQSVRPSPKRELFIHWFCNTWVYHNWSSINMNHCTNSTICIAATNSTRTLSELTQECQPGFHEVWIGHNSSWWYSFEASLTKQQENLSVVETTSFLPLYIHEYHRATPSLLPSQLWHQPFSQTTARPHTFHWWCWGVSKKHIEIDRNGVDIIVYARKMQYTYYIYEIAAESSWRACHLSIETCWFIEKSRFHCSPNPAYLRIS